MKNMFLLSCLLFIACSDPKGKILTRMDQIKQELPPVQKEMDSAILASKGDTTLDTYKRNEAINYRLFHLKNEYDSLALELCVYK